MKLTLLGRLGLVLTVNIVLFMTCHINGHSQNNIGICIDDSFYVPANSLLYINSDLKLEPTSNFVLRGECVFLNSNAIDLADYAIGNGTVILRGDLDLSIISNNSKVGNLFTEMDGADIYMEGNLDVENILKLSSGKIITGFDNVIFVSNSSENAIKYNEDALSDSYIQGNLKRAIVENGSYYFPIGNHNGYHPFYIRNSNSFGDVLVSFDESIPSLWGMNGNIPSVKMQESGAWIVKVLSDVDMQFTAGVSTLDSYQQPFTNTGNVFYASNQSFSEIDISYESVSTLPYYEEGHFKHASGIYALVNSTTEMGEIANTLLVNGYDDSRFKLDLSKFRMVRLTVFDSFGREVFNSNDYQNDFDVQHMRSGTYYYYLKGELTNGRSVNHNDFIEVIRSN